MHEKQPPREVTDLISFLDTQEYKFDRIRFYNKMVEKTNKQGINIKIGKTGSLIIQ